MFPAPLCPVGILLRCVGLCLLLLSPLSAAPRVVETVPGAGSTVEELTTVEVRFDVPVTGVDAEDLLVNGVPATAVTASSADAYVFSFAHPQAGLVEFRWTVDAGIVDGSQPAQGFLGGSWKVSFDPALARRHVMISEFMADNDVTLYDDDCDRSDWIEIYNAGTTAVDLFHWSLTDDPHTPTKWQFPSHILEPGAYLVVFASQKNKTTLPVRACRTKLNSLVGYHTNFRLDPNGEYLALVAPDGEVISEFAPAYPPQRRDVSYGRDPASPNSVGYFTKPTPRAVNSSTGNGFAPAVRFSRPGMTFVDAFALTLSCDDQDATIRYTLDGSFPSESSSSLLTYTGPIQIKNTVQVRARAFHSGLLPGTASSETYLMLTNDLTHLASLTSSLPVVVITTLKSAIIGASINTAAHFSLFEPRDGLTSLQTRPTLATRVGIKTRGSSTGGQPQSNFAVEWWDEFNQDKDLPILGMPEDSEWVLYAPSEFDATLVHNPFTMGLSRQMNFAAPQTRFVEVYLNKGGPIRSNDWFGVYVLMQKPGLAKGRIDEPKAAPEDVTFPEVTGSYLFKTDRLDPGDTGFSAGGSQNCYVEPKEREIKSPQRAPQMAYLTQYFRDMDNSLRASNPNMRDPVLGYRAYLDITNWVDFHILELLSGQVDAIRLSTYFYKPRNGKVKYGPRWDYDRAWESKADDRDNNPRVWDTGGGLFTVPWWNRVLADRDAWQLWIDRWHWHRQTTLSQSNMFSFLDSLTNQIRFSQPKESKKWPVTAPRGSYYNEVGIMKNWISNRLAWIDGQMAQPPRLSQPGGIVPSGFALSLLPPTSFSSPTNLTIYYTLDGSDPRPPDGTNPPTSIRYTAPITINANTRVTARALDTGRVQRGPLVSSPWSAPVAATYVVTPPALVLTEVMYHPAPPPAGSPYASGDFEFLELKNCSGQVVELAGYHFTSGIQFQFAGTNALTRLNPDQRAVVVANREAFLSRYPGQAALIAGQFEGQLADEGERLVLNGPADETVFDLTYSNHWQEAASGLGFSLVLSDETADSSPMDKADHWSRSAKLMGSPGAADPTPGPLPARVEIHEVFAAAASDGGDWIELFNREDRDVDVSGWWLTDSLTTTNRVPLPVGSRIPARGYLVVPEKVFSPGGGKGFGLSAEGDAVWLLSADSSGQLTGGLDLFRLGSSMPGTSFGRTTLSDGREMVLLQSKPTPGGPNSGPLVGPVILAEVAPSRSEAGKALGLRDSFVELANLSNTSVPLFDTVLPQRTWRLRGDVDFDFPQGLSLAPGARLLVVEFDPVIDPLELTGFRARHALGSDVIILGPWSGGTTPEGLSVRLMRPAPTSDGTGPYVSVDETVFQFSGSPLGRILPGWSFVRTIPAGTAADPANWRVVRSTPGKADDNQNGVPDDWERAQGLVSSVEDTDTDMDGFSDRAEHHNGTDPRNAASVIHVRTFVSSRGVATGLLDATPGRVFLLESCDQLSENGWTIEQILLVPADGTLAFSMETRLGVNRLYRVRSQD